MMSRPCASNVAHLADGGLLHVPGGAGEERVVVDHARPVVPGTAARARDAAQDSGGIASGRRRAPPAPDTERRSRAPATPAICSGITARPTIGTNAMRPRPAVARMDAAVASSDEHQHDAEDAGDLADARCARSRTTRRDRGAHADVLDGHHDLRQQIEEVDERDPHDHGARRGRRRSPSSRAARRRCRRARSRRRRSRRYAAAVTA